MFRIHTKLYLFGWGQPAHSLRRDELICLNLNPNANMGFKYCILIWQSTVYTYIYIDDWNLLRKCPEYTFLILFNNWIS